VTERKYDPGVEEALNGMVQDFKQSLINEANAICDFGKFETVNFLSLESAIKITASILRSVVQSSTLGSFGEVQGDFLNREFDNTAERRVTWAMAKDIQEKFGDKMPEDIKKRLDEILGTIEGEEPTEDGTK